jgi:TRAP-type C4-dicarboxylate transport system substrate-binding protein
MYTSSVSGVDAKAWEVLKYFTPINIVGPVNMVNVNQAAWDKLPADLQAKVLEIAADMEDEMWNLAGDMDRKSRATLVENGMTVVTGQPGLSQGDWMPSATSCVASGLKKPVRTPRRFWMSITRITGK